MSVDATFAGGEAQRVGWFRYYFADERWEWSPQVERMHGYEPGTAHPTTAMVLSHKHPDDYGQVAATLEDVRRKSAVFSTTHRIVDVQGDVHDVIVVGDRLYEGDAVVGTHGYYVDVTPTMRKVNDDILNEAVAEIAESRAIIEQTKGMLMVVYRISADAAFEVLKWRSQETNVKLKLLAGQIATDFLGLDYSEVLPAREVYDQLLLSAHLHV